jgi:hypothetical protein
MYISFYLKCKPIYIGIFNSHVIKRTLARISTDLSSFFIRLLENFVFYKVVTYMKLINTNVSTNFKLKPDYYNSQ